MEKIQLEHVFKAYNDNQILTDIHFSIRSGECFVIVGPSGSGKSTILNLIAGLTAPSDGTIKIDGVNVTNKKPKDRNVSMVFQNFALYPHMTVRDNISFALKSKKFTSKEIDAKVLSVTEKLHIEKLLKRKPQELSGGQRQRVALARALATEAHIILMDEPLSSLDADLRVKLRDELKTLHRENNTTLVFVTHDQVEAMTLAHRILVLNNGKVEQIGTPKDIYENPKTPFVGQFIGTPKINLFRDEIGNLLGIRPEHIDISKKGEKVVVQSVDYLGSESWIHFSYQSTPFILVTKEMNLRPGDIISITFKKSRIIYFTEV